MSAPSPVTRVTPVGIYLEDGFSIKIAFAADPDVSVWEKAVGIPGIDGGDEIELVTQHNVAWRMKSSRALKTLTPFDFTGAYDPACYTQLNALINVETTVTERFPDGSTLSYYGFLKGVEFGQLQEGEFPEGTFTVVPTNRDPIARTEEAPVLVSVAGT